MKRVFLSILCVTNLFLHTSFSQSEQTETILTIKVSGYKSNIGQSLLKIFRKEDNMPKNPFITLKSSIINNEATFIVKDLVYGDYAAIIVHDQNSNNEIDHSFGIPSEPLAFTNNWKLSIFSGMPSFEKLKFTFSKTNNTLIVKINN